MTMTMSASPAMHSGRQQLRKQPNCKFVDAYEFLALAVSNRTLERADEPEAGLRGLKDVVTGIRYLTEEESLLR